MNVTAIPVRKRLCT